MNAFLNQYQSNQVSTASPEQVLLMLYDGAIRFVRQAAAAIADEDRAFKAENIRKAVAIVTELSSTLDHEVGGEISQNLYALYSFMLRELTRANLKDDAAALELVERLLTQLRATFSEAIQAQRSEAAGADASAGMQAAAGAF